MKLSRLYSENDERFRKLERAALDGDENALAALEQAQKHTEQDSDVAYRFRLKKQYDELREKTVQRFNEVSAKFEALDPKQQNKAWALFAGAELASMLSVRARTVLLNLVGADGEILKLTTFYNHQEEYFKHMPNVADILHTRFSGPLTVKHILNIAQLESVPIKPLPSFFEYQKLVISKEIAFYEATVDARYFWLWFKTTGLDNLSRAISD